ncbi:5-oxoprolinase [Fulvivirga imtechensis AK7]|uniref:5-oxoprolinase n=1 Tax=Fulvivirga imtechensis AK7 TaxID=1237149 RepID=L8JP51_9BACT|nr:hydantoinase B/oxoprolinase family protein [Fulvivirga imtechensis]ELR69978.1 5-oxoprolinase [Fulvivirga imtechensis AK7]
MWKICIDTGGTFTDCLATSPKGETTRLKILSSSKLRGMVDEQLSTTKLKVSIHWHFATDIFKDYKIEILGTNERSAVESLDFETRTMTLTQPLSENITGKEFQITTDEEVPVMAARLLTMTPLGMPFPPIDMRLGSTKGTNALLERKGADVIFITTKGFKDLLKIGNQQRPDLFALNIRKSPVLYNHVIEVDERTDAHGNILNALSTDEITRIEAQIRQFPNHSSIAIALLNSYQNPTHELMIRDKLLASGFNFISCSAVLNPEIKILPRAQTTIANSYLLPIISQYIQGIQSHIDQLRIMTSAGAVVDSTAFTPKDSLLSGPAGGIVGAKSISERSGYNQILTFDMGGTSTDVAIYNNGYDYRYETVVGDAHILSPCLAIETIAAGGGSICKYHNGLLTVGPESAGAHPGPACYGAEGPLTITDVNLLCGRLVEEHFSIPIAQSKAREMLRDTLAAMKLEENTTNESMLLNSFLTIANEKMAEAIKKVSVRRGYSPEDYQLITFGGAGGQHACAIAGLLNIQTVLIPYDAGLLSAYGISQADIETFSEKQLLQKLDSALIDIKKHWLNLQNDAYNALIGQGFSVDSISLKKKLAYLRYRGQESTIEIEVKDDTDYYTAFKQAYSNIYGHWLDDQEIEVESVKLIAAVVAGESKKQAKVAASYEPSPTNHQQCLTSTGWQEAKVFIWEKLKPGAKIVGPAIVVSQNCTVFVENGWEFNLDPHNTAILHKIKKKIAEPGNSSSEAANIELFKNRFIGVVEEMGALLERTSFSVNVKERLDFSCALLDAKGELIVNAPHIPVHLGSLGICVRKVVKQLPIKEGDIVITNHPAYGGSHLPDITLISAVYHEGELIGYVANRAHHAEIGGITPGSMPTHATTLQEEGVIISPQYLASQGAFQWDKIKALLSQSEWPSRSVDENLADLKGGVAALQAGIFGLQKLCTLYSRENVLHYMSALKDYVSNKLWMHLSSLEKKAYEATEYLDDGYKLQVSISIKEPHATFDFSGTDQVHPRNLNATDAIVNSVVLYVLRLLISDDLPLNEGLMQRIKVILPHCLLHPDFENLDPQPAVVGGNTEVSQRLTDTLIKAFGLAACSQGTMNNLLFGNNKFGYYETICGGTGAGNGFNGHDAVHQHMTNTRITDPEIMEWRYPVRLKRFEIRKGSGGEGKWKGGNGVIREIEFLEPLELTILSQHRNKTPYGLKGGMPGQIGQQHLIKASGEGLWLKGIDTCDVQSGDRLVMYTPGGGGYGQG